MSLTHTAAVPTRKTSPDAGPGPVLRVEDLQVSYFSGGRPQPAVRGIDLEIGRGEVLALVGESGSGKSTVALAVLGLLPPEALVEGGQVIVGNRNILGLSERMLRQVRGNEIGLVPQDPTVSLNPVQRIGEQVAEGLRIHHGRGRREAHREAVEILASVGIDRPEVRAQQYPHELSGGMRQRVLIGIALACRPDVIVADEPTSALDVTVQRTVLDSLGDLVRDLGTSVLLITHDLGVAVDRADRIAVMSKGEIVEQGPALQIVRDPHHEYTRRLIAAAPSLTPDRLQPGVPARSTGGATEPVVEVTGLAKRFHVHLPGQGRSELKAVDGIDLTLRRGTTLALVGESGSGKSTTARLIGGLETPTTGTVQVAGLDLAGASRSQRRDLGRRSQFVHQNPYSSLDPRFSVAEIVREPLRAFRVGGPQDQERRAAEALDQVALGSEFHRRRPAELSGGQRQRVAIARALALRPDLVVLDEPVSALDVSVQAQILQLLTDLQAELGLTYLFISHDLAVVRQISDEVAVLHAGRIVESGPTEQIFSNPAAEHTRRLLEAIPGRRAAAVHEGEDR